MQDKAEYMKEWRKGNKEKVKAYAKEWKENNKEKVKAYAKIHRERNPSYLRESHYKRCYGLTVVQYDTLLRQQRGVCAICSNPETMVDYRTRHSRSLVVDHCHTTGKVRGLLCHSCNVSIGHLKDSISLLEKAISYLKEEENPTGVVH